jgi:hypothetical protein
MRIPILVSGAAALCLTALLATGCVERPPNPGPTAEGPVATAAPDGSGDACTPASPCRLPDAIAAVAGGGTVELADGEYPDLELRGSVDGSGVTIRPAEGANPVLGKVDLDVPGLTWSGIDLTGGVYLDTGADGTTLDGIHLDGSGVFVHADHVSIRSSVIENGTSIDGIQVAGATNLLVEDTIVRGFGQGEGSDVHSDCVQLFDSSEITLRGNYLGGCDNAALIFSPGQGEGVRSVIVQDNVLQGCVEESQRCSQGTALDLRDNAADVVVRGNVMIDGSVMVEQLPGLVFDDNVVGYASNCDMPMTNSVVADWNTGECDEPSAVGTDGNTVGDAPAPDLEQRLEQRGADR